MKKLLIPIFTFIFCINMSNKLSGQVSGLSYTLAPYAEYNWNNEKSGLKDGLIGGVMLGMGFGEFVELRANYAMGFGMETQLDKFGFAVSDEQILGYTPRNVNLSRYGGEIKLNLSRGALLPYLTLGTGVQSIGYDSLNTSQQIYINAGIGVKLSAGDRYTIGLQAVNSRYNFNSVNSLLSNDEIDAYGLMSEDFLSESISNWALRASLVVYLGGRKPGEITDIDKAYLDNFSGGFRGLNVPLEFQVSKMNFHEDLPFRSTWMAGGSAGLNFGPLVGIRGFYWKALQDGEISQFDDLAMYGGEARFLLNEGKGFTPWITIGAGNIQVGDEYVGKLIDTVAVSGIDATGFAMGGLGIDLPFSKYVKATGFARSILTTSQNYEDISQPNELRASWNYGVSVNFVLGKKKKKIAVVKQSAFDDYILTSDAENTEATNQLKDQYENQLKVLEVQLNQAKIEQDEIAIAKIEEEKVKAKKIVEQLNKNSNNDAGGVRNGQYTNNNSRSNSYGINMSPSEFNLLVRDIMERSNNGRNNQESGFTKSNTGDEIQSALSDYKKEQQIEKLTESLNEIKNNLKSISKEQGTIKDQNKAQSEATKEFVKSMSKQIETLEKAVNKNNTDLEALQARQSKIENGISSNENIEIQSFESAQIQRDLEYT